MSGHPDDISNSGGPGSSAEPSMEEILASIRRILKDDEAGRGAPVALDEEVLVLDAAMIAKPAELGSGTALPAAPEPPGATYFEGRHLASAPELSTGAPAADTVPAGAAADEPAFIPPEDTLATPGPALYTPADHWEPAMSENIQPPESLIGDEARDSAKSSIGALVRSIGAERSVQVSRGGITIEDIVREEIRPMLKAWLDSNLPALVERIVRSEIERVVDRTQA